MSWTDVRDAIQAAVAQASGLPAASVIWQFQNADEPPLDYISLTFGNIKSLGQDFIQTTYNGGGTGVDITQTVYGTRELALEIACFSASTADQNDASARCELIKSSLSLPSLRTLLAAQGVAPFDPGDVQYVPTIVGTGFRGRATMTVRCYLPAQTVQELTTYIATINGTASVSGGAQGGATSVPFHAP